MIKINYPKYTILGANSRKHKINLNQTPFLSAPLRSNGCRLCFATVYLFFFYLLFFYSPFVLRNYSTDSHQIFRNRVFWSSLNNPVVLKFF